jgi:RimJ/RimL family protein N-acetyltransferase
MMRDISLREVRDSDLPILFEQQLDPDATRMAAFPSRDHDAFMAHWAKIRADGTTVLRAITCGGEVAGSIVCWEHSGRHHVGYWLGKAYWGKGIASAALAQLLAVVRVRPLHAHVARHNAASIRVLQKCGFTICAEGRFAAADGAEGQELILVLEATDDKATATETA